MTHSSETRLIMLKPLHISRPKERIKTVSALQSQFNTAQENNDSEAMSHIQNVMDEYGTFPGDPLYKRRQGKRVFNNGGLTRRKRQKVGDWFL